MGKHELTVSDRDDPRVDRLYELAASVDGRIMAQGAEWHAVVAETARLLDGLYQELRPHSPPGPDRPNARATAEDLGRVRAELAAGRKLLPVCQELGLSYPHVYSALRASGRPERTAARPLSPEGAAEGRRLWAEGLTVTEIAARLGVTRPVATRAVHGFRAQGR